MKKLSILLASVSVAVLAIASIPGFAQNGNGTPGGAHYNLNLIGVTNGKTSPLTGSDRHTIFVPLFTNGKDGRTSIPSPVPISG
jgi:hypothetical protein